MKGKVVVEFGEYSIEINTFEFLEVNYKITISGNYVKNYGVKSVKKIAPVGSDNTETLLEISGREGLSGAPCQKGNAGTDKGINGAIPIQTGSNE